MGKTVHGQIGRKFKGTRYNPADKTAYRASNINTGLIEYLLKTLVKK